MAMSNESKVGIGLGFLAAVVGLVPSIIPMTPGLLLILRLACGVLTIAAIVIFADVAGYRKTAINVLGVILLLTAVAYSSYTFGVRSNQTTKSASQPQSQPTFPDLGDLFLAYGADSEKLCHAVLNGSLLIQWQRGFRLALICGIADPMTDQFTDNRITVSGPFTIAPRAIDILALHPPEVADAIQRIIKAQEAAIPKAARTSVGVQCTMWYQPVLLPINVSPTTIHTLSDVSTQKGILVPEQRVLTVGSFSKK